MNKIKIPFIGSNSKLSFMILIIWQISRVHNLNQKLTLMKSEDSPKFFVILMNNDFNSKQISFINEEWKFSYVEGANPLTTNSPCLLKLTYVGLDNAKFIWKNEGNQDQTKLEKGDYVYVHVINLPLEIQLLKSGDDKICQNLKELKIDNLEDALKSVLKLRNTYGEQIKLLNTSIDILMTPLELENLELTDLSFFEIEYNNLSLIFEATSLGIIDKNKTENKIVFTRNNFQAKSNNLLKETLDEINTFCGKSKPYKLPSRNITDNIIYYYSSICLTGILIFRLWSFPEYVGILLKYFRERDSKNYQF